ncbi:MAG: SMP-30/gluconolactonase/LRE family protein [Bacteroidales bacterium]|nr:SMP-30/gluconolactonase/LRE family protein [Bacteroidales bacterium]
MFIILLNIVLLQCGYAQQDGIIQFNDQNWNVINGEIVEYKGRESLKGTAVLNDSEFINGVIEFDISVSGARSYPGIRFRVKSGGNAENIYIRPHIIGVSQDALQYTPVYNNEACWQLYNGEGFTNGLEMPENEWIHFKIEIKDNRARVYVGKDDSPALKIEDLIHGNTKGGIILISPPNGSAYFSNFKLDTIQEIVFEPEIVEETPPGMVTKWEISQPFKYSNIDLEKTYRQQELEEIRWKKVKCEKSGLVNVSRYIERKGSEPDFVFARTFISAENEESKQLNFGYSDWIVIFLNGELLFTGSSPYQGRGTAFLGIVGLYDALMLPLKNGENELCLIVGESFGGWGFICQDGKKVYEDKRISKLWESEKKFNTSESVLYDPKREVLYVSNFDQFNMNKPAEYQFISKVSLDGQIEELRWIDSLNNPLGITIYDDRLYVAERNSIAEIEIDNGEVINRYSVPGSIFLNDIAVDDPGNIYISDSRKDVIWKYSNDKVEEWLSGEEIHDPNVLYIQGNTLFVGNSGDQSLKSVNLKDKSVFTVAKFETGFIDGFRIDKNGNYLVSLWKGKIYRVTPEGEKTKILDTSTPGYYSADFEYVQNKNLLIVPTFYGNTISGYYYDDY